MAQKHKMWVSLWLRNSKSCYDNRRKATKDYIDIAQKTKWCNQYGPETQNVVIMLVQQIKMESVWPEIHKGVIRMTQKQIGAINKVKNLQNENIESVLGYLRFSLG